MHKPSEEGQWHLEHTPCIEVLVKNKSAILNALTDAKYDKITHVRQAVGKALVEMDCIPSPRAKPTIARMLSGEDSDPENLLASKRAKPNSRPWSGSSRDALNAPGDALLGSTSALHPEDQDSGCTAPSPRSDMGADFEPEQDDEDSPSGATGKGCKAQPLHESLQARLGPRRRFAASTSGSLNRSSRLSGLVGCTCANTAPNVCMCA